MLNILFSFLIVHLCDNHICNYKIIPFNFLTALKQTIECSIDNELQYYNNNNSTDNELQYFGTANSIEIEILLCLLRFSDSSCHESDLSCL